MTINKLNLNRLRVLMIKSFAVLLTMAGAALPADRPENTICDETPRIMAMIAERGLVSQVKTNQQGAYVYEMFKSDSELVTLQHASDGKSCIFTSSPVALKRYQVRRVTTSDVNKTICQPGDDLRQRMISSGFKSVAKAACRGQQYEFFDDGQAILISKSEDDDQICMSARDFSLID